MKIAVILFAYKRPKYLKKCLRNLVITWNEYKFDYYAFVDYSEIQNKIAKQIMNALIFKEIIKRSEHLGTDKNIRNGINEIFKSYDAVIVIEDDIVVSYNPNALEYLESQLIKYQEDKNIGQISLQGNFPTSHGWAIWKDRWQNIDWGLVPLSGYLAKEYQKHISGSWDIVFHHNLDNLGLSAVGKKLAEHIGTIGVHYNILSKFGVRKYFRRIFI